MTDLRTFTRKLKKDAERDLGSGLDRVAVDHWDTDNPHVHLLVRGRGDDGQDQVISRDYISQGLRGRAAERVTLQLGPRSEQEIRAGLENEVVADKQVGPAQWILKPGLEPPLRDLGIRGDIIKDDPPRDD